eukprot:14070042-Alexandrium_andersonii.AAC.1
MAQAEAHPEKDLLFETKLGDQPASLFQSFVEGFVGPAGVSTEASVPAGQAYEMAAQMPLRHQVAPERLED